MTDVHCDAVSCLLVIRPIERCPERGVCALARHEREHWRHPEFVIPPWPEEQDDDDD